MTNSISMLTALSMMVEQFGVEEACKVAVEAFIMTDQFIAEAEVRHESSLF